MSRVRLLFSEAWSSISANISTTFAATITVLIGMLLLGLVLALGTWMQAWSGHVKRELQVKVYFDRGATQAEMHRVGVVLARDSRVKTVEFVSRDEAYKQMKQRYPELFKTALPSNPFPNSYVVTPTKGEYTPQLGRDILNARYPGVEQGANGVRWGSKTAQRVLTVARVIEVIFVVAVILLIAASTALIANTIRLSIFSRRREVEVMKLVGATNWFVRGPFMVEGLVCGLIGSILSVVLLALGKAVALPAIFSHVKGSSDVHAWPFPVIGVIVICAGLVLGAAGSGLTLRRFLQV